MHDDRATVALQFEHFFAGVRVRRIEINRQTPINHAAVTADKIEISRMAGFEYAISGQTTDGASERHEVFAGHAYDTNTASAGCGGDGCDGIRIKFHAVILADIKKVHGLM